MEYASKGVAGAGLGTGIAGLALGVLNSANNGNGILGGLFGGGCNNAAGLAGLGAVASMSEKDATIGQLRAEKYADAVGINTFKEVLSALEKRDDKYAVLFKDLNTEAVNNRIALTELKGAIQLESERRQAGDQNLYCYVNATFVPGKLVMPLDALCPSAMPRYNEWQPPQAGTQVTVTKEPGSAK